jgi:hypothetical protein
MENSKLPGEVKKKIRHSAHRATDAEEARLKQKNIDYGRMISHLGGFTVGHIAGAIEWAEKWWEVYEENGRMAMKVTELWEENENLKKQLNHYELFEINIKAGMPENEASFQSGYTCGHDVAEDKLKKESERLKAALNKIINVYPSVTGANRMRDIAAEALASKGKEGEKKIVIGEAPDLGDCKECKTAKAEHDYNGHQYYVCNTCFDRLSREFEDEYQ